MRSFCLSLGNLWLALVRLWASSGCLGTHFGAPGAALGCLALGPLWDTRVRCWDALGSFWIILDVWCLREPPSQGDGSQVLRLRSCAEQEQASWNSHTDAWLSRRSRGNGPQTTVQVPRSTRAGDQDDVSFTIALQLRIEPLQQLFCQTASIIPYSKRVSYLPHQDTA